MLGSTFSADGGAARTGRNVPHVRAYASRQISTSPEAEQHGMRELRRNALMSRQVEVGMIFMEMLGIEDARAYWRGAGLSEQVIDRLVHGHPVRAASLPGATEMPSRPAAADERISLFYCTAGRRQDLLGAAVVQAAIAIHQELGRDRAERMLRREGFDDDAIARMLMQDGARRQLVRA